MPLALVGCIRNVPTLSLPSDQTTQSQTEEDSLANVDAASLTPTLDDERHLAEELARAWHPDATLHALTALFPSNIARGQAKRVYVFGSNLDINWMTVAVNERTTDHIRSFIPKQDYLTPDLGPIPLEFYKLNTVEALQIAEKNGGKTFREQNPGSEVTASLSRQGPNGWLWWLVAYRGLDTNELKVRIHPVTGELYDEQGNVLGGSGTTPSPSTLSS